MASPPNLRRRLLTSLIAIPVVVVLVYLGGWPFGAGIAAIALIGQSEIYRLQKHAGLDPKSWLGYLLSAYLLAIAYLPSDWPHLATAVGLAALVILAMPFMKSRHILNDVSATVLGVFYPVLPLSMISYIRQGYWGTSGDLESFAVTICFVVLIWITDSAAYFVGSMFGKHPLHQRLSPKKSWEGYAGGGLGAILGAVAIKLLVGMSISWPLWIAIALICGLVSPLGDLAESAIKRDVQVKDSGNIFPGHGGMLDRIDSIIVTAPLVYVVLLFV